MTIGGKLAYTTVKRLVFSLNLKMLKLSAYLVLTESEFQIGAAAAKAQKQKANLMNMSLTCILYQHQFTSARCIFNCNYQRLHKVIQNRHLDIYSESKVMRKFGQLY